MAALAGDPNEKLAKITQEYQKIRTQNSILKKAVLQVELHHPPPHYKLMRPIKTITLFIHLVHGK